MNCVNCCTPVWLFSFVTGIVVEIFALVLYFTNDKIRSAVSAFVGGCIIAMCILSWCVFTVGNRIHRQIHYSDDDYSITTYTIDISQTSNVTEISETLNIPAIIV